MASFSIQDKQLKTAKCKMMATALHPESDDVTDSASLISSMMSSKRTDEVKFIMMKIVVERIVPRRDFKVSKSAISVTAHPAIDKEQPIRVNKFKISC